MKDKNLKGFDDYIHAFANAKATRRGVYGELTARALSYAREKWNKNIDPLLGKITQQEALEDSAKDNRANVYGRKQAKQHPDTPIHELLKPYWVKDSTGQVAK